MKEALRSLKTEEKTKSVIETTREANLYLDECPTDPTVHQQVCPNRIHWCG